MQGKGLVFGPRSAVSAKSSLHPHRGLLGYLVHSLSWQVKAHSFFRGLEWEKVLHREYEPPFHPCRPKKSTDKHGNVRYRQEPVMGINNFGKDQRDLAFNHYMRER